MTTVPIMPPIHPGEVLMEEYLEPLGVTQHKLAVAIGVPPRRVNRSSTASGASAPTPRCGSRGTSGRARGSG